VKESGATSRGAKSEHTAAQGGRGPGFAGFILLISPDFFFFRSVPPSVYSVCSVGNPDRSCRVDDSRGFARFVGGKFVPP